MTRTLDVDYLGVGAGAMGMGFVDALVDHSDARVAVVDRPPGAGGPGGGGYPVGPRHPGPDTTANNPARSHPRPNKTETPHSDPGTAAHTHPTKAN